MYSLQVAYFGQASQALSHFSSRHLHCTLHYNPADFMCKWLNYLVDPTCFIDIAVEMVSMKDSRKALIGDDPTQRNRKLQR